MSATLATEVRELLARESLERFLRYVQVHTTSDPESDSVPSTARQMNLLRLLADELRQLGVEHVDLVEKGFVYATLPARSGDEKADPFALLAHVDTSPDQPGDGVRPVLHTEWDSSPITFADDPELTLTVEDSPTLAQFDGETIITASGRTLLGADDKAGLAEIMAAVAAFQRFPNLPHGEIRIVFTSDEEIGRGALGIDLDRLPRYGYTVDGSLPGELEDECFDAWRVEIALQGVGVHPGYAKDKMINAARLAGRFAAELPAEESPERTEGREGFYHLGHIQGDHENASLRLIVRDFEQAENERRIAWLKNLAADFEKRYPGAKVEVTASHTYQNMRDILRQHPQVVERATAAIEDTGLPVLRRAIRGGTDGSHLTAQGHPTANLYAGGQLFHSRREWIAASALAQASETLVHLARRWTEG
ncbi:MAG: peptidase T [Acidobacteriota bacterium]